MSWVRTSFLCLVALTAVGLLSSCGVTADTTAATVAGKNVPVDTVNALARDELFGPQSGSSANESVISGEPARAALLLAVQAAAWGAELERFGVPLSAQAKAQANQQIDAQLGQQGAPTQISATAREVLVQFIAAQVLLGEHFKAMNESSTKDLRLLYNGLPVSRELTCMTVAAVAPKSKAAALKNLAGGVSLEDLPSIDPGVNIVATSRDCIPTALLSGAIREAVVAAPLKVVAAPIDVTDSKGAPITYLVRVDQRRQVPFQEAVPGLLKLISQGPELWVQLVVDSAQINPRYGSGVGTGPKGLPAILAPPAPELPGGGLLAPGVSAATSTP